MSDDLSTLSPRQSQIIAKAKLTPIWNNESWDYAEDHDRTILGEDDQGTILAARPDSDSWWEAVDLTKPEHAAALEESLRRGQINFLDLERNE